MEYIKKMVMDSTFISLFITCSVLIAIIYIVIKINKTRQRFYRAVLSGWYLDLLDFLLIRDKSKQKRIAGIYFESDIKKGLYNYFNSRLNVRVTSSRIQRIQECLDSTTKKYGGSNTSPQIRQYCLSVITEQLNIVIFECGPHYFASQYVESLCHKEKEEADARLFMRDCYNEYGNMSNEKAHGQFTTFIDLVNKEIDKYLGYDTSKEKRDFLKTQKISIGKSISTTTKFFIQQN